MFEHDELQGILSIRSKFLSDIRTNICYMLCYNVMLLNISILCASRVAACVACGCVWLRVAACGCVWLRVAACGCVWLRVAVFGV